MFIYPWGDLHSLNLGWFLMEFKAWVEKIQEYLDNGGGTSENLANVIAPVFNAANSYLTGDYVLYNDELYKALEPVPPGTWNPDAWVRCLVTEEMGSGSSGVDNVARLMIAGQYSNTYNYQKYAICRYADKLWMCNTNLPTGGEEWEPSHWDEITVGAGLTGLRRSVETFSQDITTLYNALNSVENGIAIIVDGDSAAMAVSDGHYAYIKNNTHGLTEGLYKANGAFPTSGGIADSSTFTPVLQGGINELYNRFFVGIIETPSEHYHYVDINKTVSGITYSNIIASVANNADIHLCAFSYSSSAFRIIARNNDGSSATSIVKINYILSI